VTTVVVVVVLLLLIAIVSVAYLAWLAWIELLARRIVILDREFGELRLWRWVIHVRRQPTLAARPCSRPWPHDVCNGWACEPMERHLRRLSGQPCDHRYLTPLVDGDNVCLLCKATLTVEDQAFPARRAPGSGASAAGVHRNWHP